MASAWAAAAIVSRREPEPWSLRLVTVSVLKRARPSSESIRGVDRAERRGRVPYGPASCAMPGSESCI